MIKRCINFLKKPTGELTNKECKLFSLAYFLLSIIVMYFLSFVISFTGKRDMLILFFIGIIPSFCPCMYLFFVYDLNKYFDIIDGSNYTALGNILSFLMFGIGLTFGIAWGVYIISNSLSFGFSVGSGPAYPGIFMFLRRNSCWSQTRTDDDGNIVYTYDTMKYWRDSMIYSCFISLGFIQISLALMNNDSIIFPLIWIICGVILVSLVLSPDILRKKLPFKNETTFELLNIIVMFCLIIFLIIFAMLVKN